MSMKLARWRDRLTQQESLNFLLTNRVPRLALTRFMGWYARIDSPALTRFSVAVWRMFTDLDLSVLVGHERHHRHAHLDVDRIGIQIGHHHLFDDCVHLHVHVGIPLARRDCH